MNYKDHVPDVVDMAYQVIEMDRELQRLRSDKVELIELRKKYMELLNGSIAHGEHMIGGLLKIALTPGVMDAIEQHNSSD